MTDLDPNFLAPPLTLENMDDYPARASCLRALQGYLAGCRGVVLDVGCGQMPYRPLVLSQPGVTRYVGLDIENPHYQQRSRPDVIWDGRHIPLDDGSMDHAVATSVFEHLPEPEQVMREVLRVLRPGGSLFFSVPFFWPLHDVPHDEYRFTPFSLERHLRRAGFGEVRIEALGGWDASLAQMIGLWVRRRPMPEPERAELGRQLFPLYRQLLESDQVRAGFREQDMVTALAGVAVRPAGAGAVR